MLSWEQIHSTAGSSRTIAGAVAGVCWSATCRRVTDDDQPGEPREHQVKIQAVPGTFNPIKEKKHHIGKGAENMLDEGCQLLALVHLEAWQTS